MNIVRMIFSLCLYFDMKLFYNNSLKIRLYSHSCLLNYLPDESAVFKITAR